MTASTGCSSTCTAGVVSSAISGPGDRGAASDGFRTYMMMLLTAAPVLIDDPARAAFPRAGPVPRRSHGPHAHGDRQVARRRRRAGRRAGRRHATATKCRGTAPSAAQPRDARFPPAPRPDRRMIGAGWSSRVEGMSGGPGSRNFGHHLLQPMTVPKRRKASAGVDCLWRQAAARLQKTNWAQRPSAAVTCQDGRRPRCLRIGPCGVFYDLSCM